MMGRLSLAIRVLFDRRLAQRVQSCLEQDPTPAPDAEVAVVAIQEDRGADEKPVGANETSSRSDALILMAALQREARLIDFLMEPLDDYSDVQVGAAVRDVHRDSRAVLDRLFAMTAVIDEAEGTSVSLGEEVEAGRVRLTGAPPGSGPRTGRLVHHGWEATKCELPSWTGSAATARVLAPAEVEV
jgi:hypothetical protein